MTKLTRIRRLILPATLLSFALGLGLSSQAHAQGEPAPEPLTKVIASAEPDACLSLAGAPHPTGTRDEDGNLNCPEGSFRKTNQTYAWSMVRYRKTLWVGTGANVLCTTAATFVDAASSGSFISDISTCEFGDSDFAAAATIANGGVAPAYLPQLGDWVPGKVYTINTESGQVTDRTPDVPIMDEIVGFRSAGAVNGMAFLAGGTKEGGFAMLAFNANTGEYIGSRRFPSYKTSRKSINVDGVMYLAAGTPGGQGVVFKHAGSKTENCNRSIECVFRFVTVGQLSGVPRELASFTDEQGVLRIAANARGLFISEAVQADIGLPANAAWEQKWTPWSYEPDLISGIAYGGGGMSSLNDGTLIFGAVLVPGRTTYLHTLCQFRFFCFGTPETEEEYATVAAGTDRNTVLFAGTDLGTDEPKFELLYGESTLPRYRFWDRSFQDTPTGWTPKFGASGYGFPNTGYTWVAATTNYGVVVGTLDTGLFVGDFENAGANLWLIRSADQPALLLSNDGLGNLRNYGFRTMAVSADGETLYVGTASMSNVENPYFPGNAGFEVIEVPMGPLIEAAEAAAAAATAAAE